MCVSSHVSRHPEAHLGFDLELDPGPAPDSALDPGHYGHHSRCHSLAAEGRLGRDICQSFNLSEIRTRNVERTSHKLSAVLFSHGLFLVLLGVEIHESKATRLPRSEAVVHNLRTLYIIGSEQLHQLVVVHRVRQMRHVQDRLTGLALRRFRLRTARSAWLGPFGFQSRTASCVATVSRRGLSISCASIVLVMLIIMMRFIIAITIVFCGIIIWLSARATLLLSLKEALRNMLLYIQLTAVQLRAIQRFRPAAALAGFLYVTCALIITLPRRFTVRSSIDTLPRKYTIPDTRIRPRVTVHIHTHRLRVPGIQAGSQCLSVH